MPDDKTWTIQTDDKRLVINRSMDGGETADSEGPTLYSPADVERFIADVRAAAERLFSTHV